MLRKLLKSYMHLKEELIDEDAQQSLDHAPGCQLREAPLPLPIPDVWDLRSMIV